MLIAFVGDTHFGVRSGSSHFATFQIKFFQELLFPYMEEHGIDTIVQMGDMWDNRTQLSLKSHHLIKPGIFELLQDKNFVMHTIVGNHDITLRESLKFNTGSRRVIS